MSAKGKSRKSRYCDWEVHHAGGITSVFNARYRRDQQGGYVFRSRCGVIHDFPPGAVHYVTHIYEPVTITADLDDDPRKPGTAKAAAK